MARSAKPTIPDDKLRYFENQLYRELSHMFRWEGLPDTIPQDYLERNLIRHGYVMYYEDEEIGEDVLRAEVLGWNRHEMPAQARTYVVTSDGATNHTQFRTVKRLTDGEDAIEQFDKEKDCVLISNMDRGESAREIVTHFAMRLAYAQQALDTNMIWANLPYFFQVGDDDTRLSIERMFSKIFNGEPFIIVDEKLLMHNKDRTGMPTDIPFIAKEIYDLKNEIMMDFKKTVGFDTAGVDKAERVNTLEVESNTEHTKTVLNIMKEQREIAAKNISAFFDRHVTVHVVGEQEKTSPGGENNGEYNSGTEEPPANEF